MLLLFVWQKDSIFMFLLPIFFSRWMVMRILVRVPLLLKAQFLWAFNVDLLPTSLYLFMSFSHACEFMRIIWQNVIILLRSIDIDIHNLFFAPFFSWIIYVCVLSSCVHDSNKKIINFLSVLFCVFLMSSGKATYCNKKKNESLKYNFLWNSQNRNFYVKCIA